jgi:hypothetical protein
MWLQAAQGFEKATFHGKPKVNRHLITRMQLRVSLSPKRRQVSCYQGKDRKTYRRISSVVKARFFIRYQ